MKALKFTLSGKTAFFKKPEANSYYYFTYGHIHKVALLGMFGAIMGYRGYTGNYEFTKKKIDTPPGFPEFYEELKGLKISVVPHSEDGMFPKKIQSFNNSVGYASKEQGGNLIVKEQWLENPAWDIYLLLTNEKSEKLAAALRGRTCVYQPYLGKNDHPADIKNIADQELLKSEAEFVRVHSLIPEHLAEYEEEDIEDLMEEAELPFRYKETLPRGLDIRSNLYEYDTFVCSNIPVAASKAEVYAAADKNIVFY